MRCCCGRWSTGWTPIDGSGPSSWMVSHVCSRKARRVDVNESWSLQLEKVIPGPIEEVFDAWLDARLLSRWMTPVPGGTAEASTDPVVGGRFRIVMMSA